MGILARFKRRDQPRIRSEPDGIMRGVYRTRADTTMTGNEAIYAAVARISNTIAQLPMHLYKGREIQSNHPLERLVSYAPNDNITAYQYQQTMEAYRNTEGNAYALILPAADGVTPESLDVLDAARVSVLVDTDSGDIYYDIPLCDGKVVRVHNSRVIALHHISGSGQRGLRPIDVLRGTLDYDRSIRTFSLTQLQGINAGVMLTVPGVGLDDKRKKSIIKQFVDAYRSSDGHIVVLEGGITASTIAHSPVDAHVLDVERITRNRVATVYNIPPHMLGDYSDTSYSTAEQTMREYLDLTITPIVVQWEQEYNRKLLSWDMVREGYQFRFDLRALSRADIATMSQMYQQAIRGGWMTINEVRASEGMPAVSNGDTLLASKDLMPVSTILAGGTDTR